MRYREEPDPMVKTTTRTRMLRGKKVWVTRVVFKNGPTYETVREDMIESLFAAREKAGLL